MYDLTNLTDADVADLGEALRSAASGASSMEEATYSMVRVLYENILDPATGETTTALVRFYKTHPYDQLDAELQAFARDIFGPTVTSGGLHCLCLLGTAGDIFEANDRAYSKIHQALPLAGAELASGIPMLSPAIYQFGIDLGAVMRPDPSLAGNLSLNPFYVPEAQGSPEMAVQDVPVPERNQEIFEGMAQYAGEFVVQYDLKSLLGFGGLLSSGELFFIFIMTKIPVPRSVAETLKGLAGYVKDAVEPFVGNKVFA